jgi:lipoprotein-releasing system permease protein
MVRVHLPFDLYIAARYIRTNVRQSFIIGLAVGLGVSIIIFTPSVNLSFFNDLLKKTVEDAPHIRVTQESRPVPDALVRQALGEAVVRQDQTLKRRRNLNAWSNTMQQLLALPYVTDAAPYVTEQIIVVHGNQVLGASMRGVVPEREIALTAIEEDVVDGDLTTLGPNQAFLGWRLADELGVHTGQRVEVVTNEGRRSLKIAGILKSGIYQTDLTTLVVPLRTAQQILGLKNVVTGISLRISDIYLAQDVSAMIENTYPTLSARNWMEDNETILEQIAAFRVIVSFINFLIILASASSITSVLIMVVASKSKEIGILKSMGATPGVLARVFVIQALFLSLIGAGFGFLGGLGWIALYNFSPFSKAETVLGVVRKPVEVSVEFTLIAVVFAIISSFLASLIPAWQAARLDPVKAINQ